MLNLKSELTIKLFGYYFINPEARHYIRELAEILKLDPGNLSKKMTELSKEGLFIAHKEGNNLFYALNKQFPLLKEYQNIYEAKYGLAQTITKELKKIAGLNEAYIYGSYAKGGFETGSDIDLLVVGDCGHELLLSAISPLEKRLRREINVTDFSSIEYHAKIKAKDFFIANIFSEKTIKLL